MRRVPGSGLVGSQRWVTTDDMRVPARSEVRAGPRRTGKDTDVTEAGSNASDPAGSRQSSPHRGSGLGPHDSVRVSRSWWDTEAASYAAVDANLVAGEAIVRAG